jgi:hypothetical protein
MSPIMLPSATPASPPLLPQPRPGLSLREIQNQELAALGPACAPATGGRGKGTVHGARRVHRKLAPEWASAGGLSSVLAAPVPVSSLTRIQEEQAMEELLLHHVLLLSQAEAEAAEVAAAAAASEAAAALPAAAPGSGRGKVGPKAGRGAGTRGGRGRGVVVAAAGGDGGNAGTGAGSSSLGRGRARAGALA